MIAFACDQDYRIPEPTDQTALVGLDLTLRVGDARISLYLDDAGHLIVDEWIGCCRMNDAIEALGRAMRLVEGFRESGQGHES